MATVDFLLPAALAGGFDLLGAAIHPLATADATLNAIATVLLLCGLAAIKRGHEQWHKRIMLAAFAVSSVFLTCYLAYHIWPVGAKNTPFGGPSQWKPVYFTILISH